jgi:hypothetical protein
MTSLFKSHMILKIFLKYDSELDNWNFGKENCVVSNTYKPWKTRMDF